MNLFLWLVGQLQIHGGNFKLKSTQYKKDYAKCFAVHLLKFEKIKKQKNKTKQKQQQYKNNKQPYKTQKNVNKNNKKTIEKQEQP